MRSQWNDEEDAALDYLPHVDQVIYLRGIRRRMDYQTGVAGLSAPISYGWLSQLLDVRVPPGSHMKPPPRLTKEQLRAVFARLERAGLVEWVRDHGRKTLIFRCPLASTDQSVSERSNPGATQEQPQSSNPSKRSKNRNISERSNPGATHAAPAMNNPIPDTGIREEEKSANALVELAAGQRDDRPPESLPARIVFDYWRDVMGHPRAKLDEKRRRYINDRLKHGFTVDDLKKAVDGCKASDWHQGKNPGRQVYDDISLICRDAEHVERFQRRANQCAALDNELADWLSEDNFIEGECRRV